MSNFFQVIPNPPTGRRLTRREMVQKVLVGLGAALALPQGLSGHPIHKHLSNAETLAQVDAAASSAPWAPTFFSSRQNASFTALAERIVPGAAKVQVNRVVDLLLSVDTAENQKAFAAALSAMDGESQKRFNQPFTNLAATQQDELLTAVSAPANRAHTLHAHFQNLKGWVVGAYYSSEEGMRELGWTEDFFYEVLPGCAHPAGHP